MLDIGVGVPSTLEFLNQFGCRVFFLDLLNLDDESYKHRLGDYSGSLFDVCLFWDLLHCLEPDQLHELNEALRPYLYSETVGYSICNVCNVVDAGSWEYRIADMNHLEVIASQAKHYRDWSQTEFSTVFDCFSIKEDRLTREGSLEMLLQAD